MTRNRSSRTSRLLAVTVVAALVALPAFAADSLFNCQSGQPFVWPSGGVGIPFNPDLGDLNAGLIDNPTGVALVQQAFDKWGDLPATSATYVNAGPLPIDVDENNYGPYFNPPAPDGFSAIVFDANGLIFQELFGANSGILGFASPEWASTLTCEILEGVAFLNGPEFTDLVAAESVMVHEFGHYSNIGHVELNGQLVAFSEGGDDSGPTPDNTTFGTPPTFFGEVLETMYPIFFGPGTGIENPNADDVAALATLYPSASFLATTGSISGTIYAPDGTTRLSGVNVIARNVADPFEDAVSTFSGAFTDSTSQADPNVGTFTLNNLTPGAQYKLFVDEVTALAGRFSNPILASLPGPEEYYNGANESSDPDVDDPLDMVSITAAAGVTTTADIVFNSPGPGVIPLGDDDFAELFLPFPFEICGQTFNSVFVNSNGSLTFGSGDTDFSESVGEFLDEAPRIAGVWDDLSPNNGGTVSFSQTSNTFSVRFENVPEFISTGANTFEFTLHRSSNHIDVAYGNLTAADGLAGVSCGGAITSGAETESDLSGFGTSTINLQNQPALYDLFTSSDPNDLANSTVEYNGTTDYDDDWAEPNDSLSSARHLQLPFDSFDVGRFTEIEPTGGDVDFYRFDADAGQSLVAEVVAGNLDSLLGLFDSAGNLIAIDDDGGVGLLSKIVFEIPATGQYTLAVTTFPDSGFTGAGSSGGRYVLDLFAFDGVLIDLGDDDSEEVTLGFTFPFQGSSYTSVFVNSNGNLTFGSGDTDFTESVGEFLSDQPRIAPLWDDLSPNNGGQVTLTRDTGTATVTFDGVPEFISTGSNTFSVTLNADGSVVIEYGAVSAADGLVGVTPGGGAADPGETDLSAAASLSVNGTTYELFTSGDPFDLDGATLELDP